MYVVVARTAGDAKQVRLEDLIPIASLEIVAVIWIVKLGSGKMFFFT
jgi:hypothetical protein